MAEIGAQPLDDFRWQKRVILMLARTTEDAALQRQTALLEAAADGVAARDLVLVQVGDDGCWSTARPARRWMPWRCAGPTGPSGPAFRCC